MMWLMCFGVIGVMSGVLVVLLVFVKCIVSLCGVLCLSGVYVLLSVDRLMLFGFVNVR